MVINVNTQGSYFCSISKFYIIVECFTNIRMCYYISLKKVLYKSPMPVAARSKAWVCGRSVTGIVGSNPVEGMDVCLL
jgi:hypothetical protein